MSTTIIAKPVIKEKFWILEREGARVGMMNFRDGDYVVSMRTANVSKEIIIRGEEGLKTQNIQFASRDMTHGGQMTVMGFPTDQEDVFNVIEIDGYPCFTKKSASKSVHAAGWYGVKFKNGWVQSFCPRLSTVQGYESVGPFKNQTDLRLTLQQKRDARIIDDQEIF